MSWCLSGNENQSDRFSMACISHFQDYISDPDFKSRPSAQASDEKRFLTHGKQEVNFSYRKLESWTRV